jgi:carbamate kinase
MKLAEDVSTVVVALGGNAIARYGDDGSIATQYRRAEAAMEVAADLIASGARVILTHGNGPVIGNIVLRGELARGTVPPTPLYIAGADSEGGLGLLLQQALGNVLRRRGDTSHAVATIVTQVIVEADDPAFRSPTKPIGPYYEESQAKKLTAEHGWVFACEGSRGWRRVVASPRPLEIVESAAVTALVDAGVTAIAAGGGGVPVTRRADGTLSGIDAVIDKDWTGALLARTLGARLYVILMEADAVYAGYGEPDARRLAELTPERAGSLAATMPPGGIGPKLAAAAWFAIDGGMSVICAAEELREALEGRSGTIIRSQKRLVTKVTVSLIQALGCPGSRSILPLHRSPLLGRDKGSRPC